MTKLERLSLNSCKLDHELLETLATALETNTVLQELNLYSNDINSEGALIVAKIIKDKINLKILGLSNNAIGFSGAREIAS